MPAKMKGLKKKSVDEEVIAGGRSLKGRALSKLQAAAVAVRSLTGDIVSAVLRNSSTPLTAGRIPVAADGDTIADSGYLWEGSAGIAIGHTAPGARLDVQDTGTTYTAIKGTINNASSTLAAVWARIAAGLGPAVFIDGGEKRRIRQVTGTFGISESDNVIVVYVVSGTGAIAGTFGFSPSAATEGMRWRIIDGGNFATTRNINITGPATGQFSDATSTKSITAAGGVLDIEVIKTATSTYKFHATRLARA